MNAGPLCEQGQANCFVSPAGRWSYKKQKSAGASEKCSSTVVSSICSMRWGIGGSKVPLDVVVVSDSNCALLCERLWPTQRPILEAVFEDKELALLLERVAGLHQRA